MAQNSAADDDGSLPDQVKRVKQIETIVVDADAVVEHFDKNSRYGAMYDNRKFRVEGARTGGQCTVSAGVDPRDDGAYYDSTPHPVWINPSKFIEGASRDEPETGATRYPTRAESKDIARSEFDGDEDSEEFEEFVDETHEIALDEWRSLVRHNLKDEITFDFRWTDATSGEERTETHTVDVEYSDD